MAGETILVIDAGTTSTRAMLFAADGTLLGVEARELTQSYPRPGWVEHDPEEIWRATLACAGRLAEGSAGHRRHRHLQSARNRRLLVEADGPRARAGDRLAGPAHRRGLRTAEGCGPGAGAAGEDGPAARSLFQRLQDRLGARQLA
jgi:glycerol kinase